MTESEDDAIRLSAFESNSGTGHAIQGDGNYGVCGAKVPLDFSSWIPGSSGRRRVDCSVCVAWIEARESRGKEIVFK